MFYEKLLFLHELLVPYSLKGNLYLLYMEVGINFYRDKSEFIHFYSHSSENIGHKSAILIDFSRKRTRKQCRNRDTTGRPKTAQIEQNSITSHMKLKLFLFFSVA